MSKSTATTKPTPLESEWRTRLARFASSGKTVEAFCRDEGVSSWNFYRWRKRLGMADQQTRPAVKRSSAPFIDLGPMPASQANNAMLAGSALDTAASVEIRLELGGVILTIARR